MRLPLLVSAVIAIAFAQNPRYEAIEIENVEVIYVEPEEASTCDTSVFNKCAIEHVKELGVRPGTGPSFYARRIMALEAVYGREGFRKICKADQTFRKCVGRTFDQCMTVDGLIAVGLPRSQALAYVEMFRKKDYECTNMQSITAKGTWECLGLTALDDGVEAMGVCMTVFVRHLTEKPRDACKFAQQYDLCIRRIFESRCGAKVGRGICEIVKIGLNLRLPQCQITCSKEESKHFPNRPHAVGHEFVTERRLINALESSEETDDDEECNANRLKQCATEAKNSLGITTSQIEQVIEKAGELAKTKEGYLRVCQAKKQFTQCAGSTVLPQCLKMESLMELGLSIINAAEVNISYFIMDFECKDEVFADNYECVMRAQKERYEELMTCQQHFQEMVSQQPSQDILCKALQDLANCNQQAYADECGAQVGEEICEFSGLMVKNFMPETQSCSVQCSTQQTSMMRRILPNYVIEENVNIVDVEEAMENDCDPTKFRQCAGAFKKGLGLHGKGVRSVIAGLKSIVDKEGKQGFQRICSAGAQFGKCGGGECTTIESLVTKLNMSKADAVMLNVTVFSLTYECSHPVFTQNFDCLVQTQKAKKHVIKRCEKRFIKEMKLHPGIPCKAAQQLMECTVSPFKRACGAPVAEGLCEFEKKYIETYLPHAKGCPLHCTDFVFQMVLSCGKEMIAK